MAGRFGIPGVGRQHGGAVVALLVLLGVGAIAIIANRFVGETNAAIERNALTTVVLKQAKDALIARAALDNNRPGSLPCPDLDGNGSSTNELMVGNDCPAYIGLLPWRTLDLPDLRDAYGQRLWYALSRSLRDHRSAEPINSDTPSDLVLDGMANYAAAIVFSPGPPLPGQARVEPSALTPAESTQYLDLSNGDGDSNFVSTGPAATFNDRVMAVARDELFGVVQKRVAGELKAALRSYYAAHRFFPLPADFGESDCLGNAAIASGNCESESDNHGRVPAFPDTPWDVGSPLNGTICLPTTASQDTNCTGSGSSPNWFQRNAWRELVHYAVSRQCSDPTRPDCSGIGGPLEFDGRPSNVVVIVAGRTIAAQLRGSASDKQNEQNYLEEENLASPVNRYVSRTIPPSGLPFNDTAVSIE